MRVVFFGTPQFAVPTLAALRAAGHEIVLLISQPDKPSGRGLKVAPTPTKQWASAHGVAVYQAPKVNNDEVRQRLAEASPDVIAVAAYGKILPKWILDLPRFGAINVHASLLPKYRGAAPIQWAIIRGETVSGVTIMQMDPGMDTGDILLQGSLPIGPYMTAGELHDQLSGLGAELLVAALDRIAQGTITPVKQDNAQATMAPMLGREAGKIAWEAPAAEVHNLVRGLNPWPGAFTTWRNERLQVWRTAPIAAPPAASLAARSGQIAAVGPYGLVVACGQGTFLTLLELQLPNRKRLTAREFVNGAKPEVGDRFGVANKE